MASVIDFQSRMSSVFIERSNESVTLICFAKLLLLIFDQRRVILDCWRNEIFDLRHEDQISLGKITFNPLSMCVLLSSD